MLANSLCLARWRQPLLLDVQPSVPSELEQAATAEVWGTKALALRLGGVGKENISESLSMLSESKN